MLIKSLTNGSVLMENSAHVVFNDKKLNNVRFLKLNSYAAIGENATQNNILIKA